MDNVLRGRATCATHPQRRRARIPATQRSANQLSTGKMPANRMSTTCAPAPVDTLSLSTAVHTRQEAVSKKCAEVIAMISGLVRNVRTRNFLPGAKDALRKTARRTLKDTLIKAASLSASLLPAKTVMPESLKSAENTVDSGRWGRDAPFGRLRAARWLCHSSLCGACHIASSFLASAPLAASELRGFNQSILE